MSDAEFQRLLAESLRRPLTDEERAGMEAYFDANLPARDLWKEEAALTQLLKDLPDAALSSNFTARVLQAADRETDTRRPFLWFRLRPISRLAWACGLALVAGLSYQQYQAHSRASMAASLARVARGVESAAVVAQLPTAELWQDFDSISRLPESRPGRAIAADEELLAALR